MILLWGVMQDKPLAAVHGALQRQGAEVRVIDQLDILETGVDLTVDGRVEGRVTVGDVSIDLGDVTAVYLRTYDWRRLPEITEAGPGSAAWQHALAVEEAIAAWLEVTPALVVNPPAAMATNNSKPFQAILIRQAGFDTPETLVTTDPAAVLEFREVHKEIVYKSVSGTRSIVSRLNDKNLDRLDDIAWCPTQFQQYVAGTDYRVHVVGDNVFACKVVSDADDYRYGEKWGMETSFRPCWIPDEQAKRCVKLARDAGLTIAGVDLRQTPDGRWYCFEINPSPGFTYYQAETGQPIDEAVAGLLMKGYEDSRRVA
ncbi:MAG: RimK domain-containing protein ATP-grasp [Nitrospirota bacterium]|nr:RimK domain-containing protein ATP-grasp [Nitrospirota bacterium]